MLLRAFFLFKIYSFLKNPKLTIPPTMCRFRDKRELKFIKINKKKVIDLAVVLFLVGF